MGKWLSEAQTEFSSQRMDGKRIFSNGIYRVYWTISEADCKNNALSLRDLTTLVMRFVMCYDSVVKHHAH